MTLRSGTQSAIEQERLDGVGPLAAYLMDSGVALKYVLGSGKKSEATAFLKTTAGVQFFDNVSTNEDRYFYQVSSTKVIA